MDERSIRKKGITLNILGIIFVMIGWLLGGVLEIIFFVIGAGFIVGVLGGKIVRSITFKYDFEKGLISIFVFSVTAGLISGLLFGAVMGMLLGVLVLIVIGIYNSDMKETLENFKPRTAE